MCPSIVTHQRAVRTGHQAATQSVERHVSLVDADQPQAADTLVGVLALVARAAVDVVRR